MSENNIKIVVTGDIVRQRVQWKSYFNESKKQYTWQSYPTVNQKVKLGEDFLLAKLVKLSTDATIITPKLNPIDNDLDGETLESAVELELFAKTNHEDEREEVYRINNYLGFSGPQSGKSKLFPLVQDDENADIVIIDDENNGFNSSEYYWPLALKNSDKSPIIIYKTNNLGKDNSLLNHLAQEHLDNTIVVINADDLRSRGVNISKSISWERTALDFVWQIENNQNIGNLANHKNLIVLFGVEGAIHYSKNEQSESRLYFLTYEFEGDFIKEELGKMYGITSCFVAGVTRSIVTGINNHDTLKHSISEGIREGLVAAHKYFINGFGTSIEDSLFPNPDIFNESDRDFIYKEQVQDVNIRKTNNPNCQSCWYIIKDKNQTSLAEISFDIVKNGEKSVLNYMPIAQFGKLKTVDRTEIEGYRSIKNLLTEYLAAKNSSRPLSIAVFGTPGSGKSFGVTEIASSIDPTRIRKLDFNLSQFQDSSDLIAAFHKVRDLALEGLVPLVFFDEFDSDHNGSMGWLKYFLSPMQDGKFMEGETVHPIGKAIFVFAGGTSSTFNEFCGDDIVDEQEKSQFKRSFQNSKGPDFVSRLRGFVNILGPNQTDNEWDQLFIVRRAMLLRSLLERKVPYLINREGEAQIDNGVINALLKVPRYKHESRSMEAILEMSMLSNAKKWEQASLPSKEQLKLHVDEEQFTRLLMHEEFFSEKIGRISKDLHGKQIGSTQIIYGPDIQRDNNCYIISEEEKAYIKRQVSNIPIALQKINYEVVSVTNIPELIEFSEEELNILGEYVHKSSSLEMKELGWIYGKSFDSIKKTTPTLVSWEMLSKKMRSSIIKMINTWPGILADSNFEIRRSQLLCRCEAQRLTNRG